MQGRRNVWNRNLLNRSAISEDFKEKLANIILFLLVNVPGIIALYVLCDLDDDFLAQVFGIGAELALGLLDSDFLDVLLLISIRRAATIGGVRQGDEDYEEQQSQHSLPNIDLLYGGALKHDV